MKIAVISDSHDNLANIGLFLKEIKKDTIKKIICCGDLCNEDTMKYLSENFTGTIYIIKGNADNYEDEDVLKYKNIKYLGRYSSPLLNNVKIGMCHEPEYISKLLEKHKDLTFIFYGHTHKPWISMRENSTLVNPGTLGGVFQKASFAIFDTTKKDVKLKILH
ncbi:MAG: YfcE family phosphodiesterase [Patescibacteria group bacterium]